MTVSGCECVHHASGAFFSGGHFDFVEEDVLVDHGVVLPEGQFLEGLSAEGGQYVEGLDPM